MVWSLCRLHPPAPMPLRLHRRQTAVPVIPVRGTAIMETMAREKAITDEATATGMPMVTQMAMEMETTAKATVITARVMETAMPMVMPTATRTVKMAAMITRIRVTSRATQARATKALMK